MRCGRRWAQRRWRGSWSAAQRTALGKEPLKSGLVPRQRYFGHQRADRVLNVMALENPGDTLLPTQIALCFHS